MLAFALDRNKGSVSQWSVVSVNGQWSAISSQREWLSGVSRSVPLEFHFCEGAFYTVRGSNCRLKALFEQHFPIEALTANHNN